GWAGEGVGDAGGGEVVVGGPDAAGGEPGGVAVVQRVERLDDHRLVVGDDALLLQVDADIGEILGDVADVLVLGAPGQDLVADDEQGGGDDARCPGRGVIHGARSHTWRDARTVPTCTIAWTDMHTCIIVHLTGDDPSSSGSRR